MSNFNLLQPDDIADDDEFVYPEKVIRETIKHFYKLPPGDEVVLDLKRIYPYLGKEWQDVFLLYALGYPLRVIAHYWKVTHNRNGSDDPVARKRAGNKVVAALLKRIKWLLVFRLVPASESIYLSQNKTR